MIRDVTRDLNRVVGGYSSWTLSVWLLAGVVCAEEDPRNVAPAEVTAQPTTQAAVPGSEQGGSEPGGAVQSGAVQSGAVQSGAVQRDTTGGSRDTAEPEPKTEEQVRDAEPEHSFWAAAAAYEAGEYRRAIELFEKYYAESEDVRALFNIAQTHRKLGECEPARASFQRFAEKQQPLGERATTWFDAFERECPPPQPADPDVPRLAADSRLPQPAALNMPRPGLALGVFEPDAAPHSPSAQRVAGWTLIGLGSLSVLGSALYVQQASDAHATAEQEIQRIRGSSTSYDETRGPALEEDEARYRNLAWGLGIGGLVAAGVGTVLLLSEDDDGAPNVEITVQGERIGASWRATF